MMHQFTEMQKATPSYCLAYYASDKVDYTPIHAPHHYGDFYDNLFSGLKHPISILEIGTLYGQSLMAWRLAFPNAKITGIDLIGNIPDESFNINFIKDDIKNVKLTEKYDVILDDSSHDLQESTYIVKNFCENLTEQGVMVIEDIQIPDLYTKELMKVLPQGFNITTYDFREITKGAKHDDFIIKIIRNV